VLAESVLLGVVGGLIGLILAAWTTDVLVDLAPPSLPRLEDASLDMRAFLVGLAVSLAAAIAFGIAPALGAARPQPEITLRGGRSTETQARRNASDGLIAFQIALAVTVLAGAGLLFRTFSALRATDPGFDPVNVVSLHLAAPASRYPSRAESHVFLNTLRDRLEQLPGVERTALTSRLPLSGGWTSDGNVEFATSPGIRNVGHRDISPGYLGTVRTELLAGRDFTDADSPDAPLVVILNQTAAQQFFRGENPLGRRITFDHEAGPTSIWYTVVGVVENTRHDGLRTEPRPEVLGSFAQQGGRAARVLIRTTVDPLSIVDGARTVLRELDADIPIQEVRTLESVVSDAVARERFLLVLMATFAALALILAAIGVYGTTAHAVRRRTAEIGVRMALGAQPRDVATWVLRFAIRPVLVGGVLGLGGALLAGRLLRNLLFGVAPTDPATIGLVVTMMLAVPFVTALLPAARAARTEPLRVLRED
jgi:predicted permease